MNKEHWYQIIYRQLLLALLCLQYAVLPPLYPNCSPIQFPNCGCAFLSWKIHSPPNKFPNCFEQSNIPFRSPLPNQRLQSRDCLMGQVWPARKYLLYKLRAFKWHRFRMKLDLLHKFQPSFFQLQQPIRVI